MPDSVARLARAVLAQNLNVKKGESVLLESWTHGLPYIQPFVREARRLGARPTVLYEDEGAWWDAANAGNTKVIGRISEAERAAIKNADVYVYFWGPEDRPRAAQLPENVRKALDDANEEWYATARKAGLRGCRMNLGLATAPQAKLFGLDAGKWQTQMLAAGATSARRMASKGAKVRKALEGGSELRVQHPNGTDLTLRLKGVHSRVDAGYVGPADLERKYGMMTNNPSGQVLAAIDRSKAEGTFVSNRAIYIGTDIYDGVRWTFEQGRLVSHAIKRGSETFEKQYADAPKGRDRFSFISIGLNAGSKGLPPVEDTEEGALMAGIGANAQFGGSVRIPFAGFGLLGGGTIEVDGKPIVRNGRIL